MHLLYGVDSVRIGRLSQQENYFLMAFSSRFFMVNVKIKSAKEKIYTIKTSKFNLVEIHTQN